MTQAEIKEAAHGRTGRRAEQNGVDADALLLASIQEICAATRWPWRKKAFSFSSVASTGTYDLTDSTVADLTDFEELICLFRFDSNTQYSELNPLTDDKDILAAIAQTATTDANPSGYFLEPGSAECELRLNPTPASVKTYRGLYFAIPSALDSSSGAVPLIPLRWHWVLTKRLEAAFWESLVKSDETEAKYTMCMNEYQMGLNLMLRKTKFSTKERRAFVSGDDAVIAR
jgi:hypothetical protein